MKRRIAAALAAALLLASGCSPKEVTLNAPAQAEAQTLRVQATAETSAMPDIASISIGVSSTDAAPEGARAKNAEKVNAVVAALAELGVAAEDIRTSNIRLYQDQRYNASGVVISSYYQMDTTLRITSRDLAAADVRSVTEDLEDYPYAYTNPETGGAAAEDAGTQLMAGSVTVSASVTVEFGIE